MINFLQIFKDYMSIYPDLFNTIYKYALLEDNKEKDKIQELLDKFGYVDTDSIQREEENEWN